MRRRALATAGILGVCAGAPAVVQARTATVGSSLKAEATVSRAKPVDSAYWPAKRAGGPRIGVPFRGQATAVRLKGGIVATPGKTPFDLLHFQVLRKVGAKWLVVSTSEDFTIPVLGDPSAIHAYSPGALCVRKGDRIALSNAGGFGDGYSDGVPFKTFAKVKGAATNAFTGAGGNMDGDRMRPRRLRGVELLVQTTVVGGSGARPFCRQ